MESRASELTNLFLQAIAKIAGGGTGKYIPLITNEPRKW
jgi:hypothetical protein